MNGVNVLVPPCNLTMGGTIIQGIILQQPATSTQPSSSDPRILERGKRQAVRPCCFAWTKGDCFCEHWHIMPSVHNPMTGRRSLHEEEAK